MRLLNATDWLREPSLPGVRISRAVWIATITLFLITDGRSQTCGSDEVKLGTEEAKVVMDSYLSTIQTLEKALRNFQAEGRLVEETEIRYGSQPPKKKTMTEVQIVCLVEDQKFKIIKNNVASTLIDEISKKKCPKKKKTKPRKRTSSQVQ
jgi:hypothetical protein